MSLLDFLTLLSYVALNVDIILQLARIYKTKSTRDISLIGLTIRYIAIVIILVKFVRLNDQAIIIGQGFIALTCTAYFALAFFYYLSRPKKR